MLEVMWGLGWSEWGVIFSGASALMAVLIGIGAWIIALVELRRREDDRRWQQEQREESQNFQRQLQEEIRNAAIRRELVMEAAKVTVTWYRGSFSVKNSSIWAWPSAQLLIAAKDEEEEREEGEADAHHEEDEEDDTEAAARGWNLIPRLRRLAQGLTEEMSRRSQVGPWKQLTGELLPKGYSAMTFEVGQPLGPGIHKTVPVGIDDEERIYSALIVLESADGMIHHRKVAGFGQ